MNNVGCVNCKIVLSHFSVQPERRVPFADARLPPPDSDQPYDFQEGQEVEVSVQYSKCRFCLLFSRNLIVVFSDVRQLWGFFFFASHLPEHFSHFKEQIKLGR